MKYYSDNISYADNNHKTRVALTITFGGNLLLAIVKFLASRISDSSALSADAFNSISDVLYSLMLVVGLYIALRPADPSHPQGHHRFEPLVGLAICFSMAWAGYSAFAGSIDKMRNGFSPIELGLPSIVLIGSAIVKTCMYLAIIRIAREIDSPTLKTAALDNIMDTMTSLTAIVGILLSRIAPLADPIAGILVALWIFKAAFSAMQENLSYLTGGGASEEQLQEMKNAVLSVPGVLNIHQLMAEFVGTKLLLDVHINVDGNKTLYEVHAIESQVEEILKKNPDVERAYVHAEPPEFT